VTRSGKGRELLGGHESLECAGRQPTGEFLEPQTDVAGRLAVGHTADEHTGHLLRPPPGDRGVEFWISLTRVAYQHEPPAGKVGHDLLDGPPLGPLPGRQSAERRGVFEAEELQVRPAAPRKLHRQLESCQGLAET